MDMELSFSLPTAITTGLICLIIYLIWTFKPRNENQPPCYRGWVPWLGCALEFGKDPLDFIERKRKELGPLYTLYVAGERLTFVTEDEGFQQFFQSPNVDFQKAVQGPVQHVASVTEESFFKFHTKIHDMVKGKLAPSRLHLFTDKLCKEFQQQISGLGNQGSGDLNQIVRETMYAGVINNLFGNSTLPTTDKAAFKELERHFVLFDDQFEYGSKLPPFVLRDWSASKQWLLTLFKNVIEKIKSENSNNKETLMQSLLKTVDEEFAPNYGLLLLWASLANAIPITFWCLSFILNNPGVLQKLQDELKTVFGEDSIGECPIITEEILKKLPYLRCCTLEAIRLRPTGIITRRVIKPIRIGSCVIPANDMLMLSPYWAHRDSKYFPQPDLYNPERWLITDDKQLFLDGFIAFGGGRYQCPGKWFALLEIQMYVAMFIQRYDCKLINSIVPNNSKKHLVGTQQPADPCPFEYSVRRQKN